MSNRRIALTGAEIFDGVDRWHDHALIVEGTEIAGIVAANDTADAEVERLDGGLLCPGFVDLQVNGGGGVMFNDDQSLETLNIMASAHARMGATSILPTLITDAPDRTARAIDAAEQAIAAGVDGIIGLHLEGPHLSISRKGAHDPALIRPLRDADMDVLLSAAKRLPMLKVTVAPESVTADQIGTLSKAGIVLSLGHSDASFETCQSAARAGAVCVTHLFNAMSQLGNREPGLVGAALMTGELSAGLIADGVHVHPASIGLAMAAKRGPGQIFLVSDSMAVAGTDMAEFLLNGRRVVRTGNRLTLHDGTLAGADLDQLTAVRNLVSWGVATEDEALAMATSRPAALCPTGRSLGRLVAGSKADILHLKPDQSRCAVVWQSGTRKIEP